MDAGHSFLSPQGTEKKNIFFYKVHECPVTQTLMSKTGFCSHLIQIYFLLQTVSKCPNSESKLGLTRFGHCIAGLALNYTF